MLSEVFFAIFLLLNSRSQKREQFLSASKHFSSCLFYTYQHSCQSIGVLYVPIVDPLFSFLCGFYPTGLEIRLQFSNVRFWRDFLRFSMGAAFKTPPYAWAFASFMLRLHVESSAPPEMRVEQWVLLLFKLINLSVSLYLSLFRK